MNSIDIVYSIFYYLLYLMIGNIEDIFRTSKYNSRCTINRYYYTQD